MSPRGKSEDEAVLRLVRKALGTRAEGLTVPELRALARDFVQAGTAAVRVERTTSAREATRLVGEARDRLHRARHRAGEVSDGKRTDGIFVPPPWRPAERVLEAHRHALLKQDGVVGCGIAHRHRAGAPVPERCVVVLVEKKLPPGDLGGSRRLIDPVLDAKGHAIPTDVVEMGTFQLKAGPGSLLTPDGLALRGTLGCYAEDRDAPGAVALTAMHLLGGNPDEFPGTPPSTRVLRFSSGSQPVGRLLRGTRTRVDAAKISVDSGLVTRTIPGVGELKGARPIDVGADANIAVRMVGAASGLLHGTITFPLVHIAEFPALGPCIVTDIRAVHGDSGALLVDGARMGLGLLVGGGDVLNAFTPLSAVLSEVRARIRTLS